MLLGAAVGIGGTIFLFLNVQWYHDLLVWSWTNPWLWVVGLSSGVAAALLTDWTLCRLSPAISFVVLFNSQLCINFSTGTSLSLSGVALAIGLTTVRPLPVACGALARSVMTVSPSELCKSWMCLRTPSPSETYAGYRRLFRRLFFINSVDVRRSTLRGSWLRNNLMASRAIVWLPAMGYWSIHWPTRWWGWQAQSSLKTFHV